ncbi:MAG: MFS transporter, partial [Treponema maltophilum]
QAFIQLMMLMFLADCVDYGHWKLGKRNDSISFSLQPFINKLSGAVSNGIVSAVVIISGIKEATSAADVSAGGLLMMKIAMLVFPPLCIVASYILYRVRYKIDENMYQRVLTELEQRGELTRDSKNA